MIIRPWKIMCGIIKYIKRLLIGWLQCCCQYDPEVCLYTRVSMRAPGLFISPVRMNFLLYRGIQCCSEELASGLALTADVAGAAALVAVLGPAARAVLHDVPNLVAVVAGVLLLVAVPGNVTGPVTLVATVLLLATVAREMTKPVALVALVAEAAGAIPAVAVTSVTSNAVTAAASTAIVTAVIVLGTLTGKVTDIIAPIAD